jgi:hypothetical protein
MNSKITVVIRIFAFYRVLIYCYWKINVFVMFTLTKTYNYFYKISIAYKYVCGHICISNPNTNLFKTINYVILAIGCIINYFF